MADKVLKRAGTSSHSHSRSRSPRWSRRSVIGVGMGAGIVAGTAWAAVRDTGPATEVRPPPTAIDSGPPPAPESVTGVPSRPPSRPGAGRWAGPETYPGIPYRFRYDDFEIRRLPAGSRPNDLDAPVSLVDDRPHDSHGVRMYPVHGELHDHPVAQAQYGLLLVDSYRLTGRVEYLSRARRQAQRLVDRRVAHRGGWFYPYDYEHRMHLRYETLAAGWFSMMAQGQALSLFSRLAQVTGDAEWHAAAKATFASFLVPPVGGRPWGVYVVDGLLWLEEYANPRRVTGDRTYNGHNFSAYGLWDYWMLTRDEKAKLLLLGALTTSRDVYAQVRDPGWRSRYCLSHGTDAVFYHNVHVGQFIQLHALTADPFFARLADLYYADFPPYEGHGTVLLAKGSHTGHRFDENGRVTASRTISLPRPGSAPAVGRVKIAGSTGMWYELGAGKLAGYHVRESGRAFQTGRYANIDYRLPQAGVVARTPVKAYTVDSAGRMTAVPTDYQVGDLTAIGARAMLNGAEHLRLASGEHAGEWVDATAIDLEASRPTPPRSRDAA